MEKKISKIEKIEKLINEYNVAEGIAYDKLVEIFYLLKRGGGYKRLVFEGSVMANCWGFPDKHDNKKCLNKYDRSIKSYEIANPESMDI